MRYTSYEEVFDIIKTKGPIEFHDVVQFIADAKQIKPEFYRGGMPYFPHQSEVSGYIANLKRNGFIKSITKHSKMRKTIIKPNKWVAIMGANQ